MFERSLPTASLSLSDGCSRRVDSHLVTRSSSPNPVPSSIRCFHWDRRIHVGLERRRGTNRDTCSVGRCHYQRVEYAQYYNKHNYLHGQARQAFSTNFSRWLRVCAVCARRRSACHVPDHFHVQIVFLSPAGSKDLILGRKIARCSNADWIGNLQG